MQKLFVQKEAYFTGLTQERISAKIQLIQEKGGTTVSEYILSCCSTADLSRERFFARDIHYVCFHYYVNDVEYKDDLGESMSFPDFYQALREGAESRSSQVSMGEYLEYFRPFLQEGKDILHVSFSSGLSGTINSARNAAEMLQEEFPERRIFIVDSLGASSGYGLLMEALADLRDEGKSIEELRAFAEQRRLHVHHWFFSTDLSFYVKGGRISKAAGFFGGVMGICPLLNMDDMGRLAPREKIRSKKKTMLTAVERMAEHAEGGEAYSGRVNISHSDCYEDARSLADLIEERFSHLADRVRIYDVGTTIGSHTGPGTVALFFWGDEREGAEEE